MAKNTEHAGPPRRRRWTPIEKLRIVEESFGSGASVPELARRHNITPGMIHRWRHEAKTGALPAAPDTQSQFALVAVAGSGNECSGTMVEVVLRNGRILRLSEMAVPGRAAQLADALEGGRP
jgi:transposase